MKRLQPAHLGTRLLLAQALVVLVGVATTWVVGSMVGPALFHEHMVATGHENPSEEALHAEAAFQSATVIAQAVALVAALAVALAVSYYITRRIGRLVQGVAVAAATIATGDYEARVQAPRLGPEFDVLARSFNQMAGRLADVEQTRRRLLGDLAHELRTPIATLDAYLEAAQDGLSDLDGDTLGMLRTQTERLARLAEDISAVSRAEESQLGLDVRALDLVTLLQHAVAAAAPGYEAKGVSLVLDLGSRLPTVRGDEPRLGQVLTNLLDNALRHTPAGGRVTVTANRSGRTVRVSVLDNGEGIPEADVGHVLERFYRVGSARDRDHGGSGIGLTIAQAIVTAHGGDLQVTSPGPGHGTTVTWWIPMD